MFQEHLRQLVDVLEGFIGIHIENLQVTWQHHCTVDLIKVHGFFLLRDLLGLERKCSRKAFQSLDRI